MNAGALANTVEVLEGLGVEKRSAGFGIKDNHEGVTVLRKDLMPQLKRVILPQPRHTTKMLIRASILATCCILAAQAETFAQSRDNSLERAAADYISFREDVNILEATPFSSAETTRDAHRRLSSHQSKELSAGWVAFAALVAAETPEFAQALQNEVKEKRRRRRKELSGRDSFFAKLSADPSYPRQLPGADQAMTRVLQMTSQDGQRIFALGETFKTQAYAMQKTRWGKARIAPSSSRIQDADGFKQSRAKPETQSMAGETNGGVTMSALASNNPNWSADWGVTTSTGSMTEKNAQVIMDRVLNLAARYAVGGLNSKTVSVYARNDRADQCLSMAALTLRQCIAATRTPYEEAFCLGEHGLNDIASCTGWILGDGVR